MSAYRSRAPAFFAGARRSPVRLSAKEIAEAERRIAEQDAQLRHRETVGHGPRGPHGTARGLREQLARGCPRCGREVRLEHWGMTLIVCDFCRESFRASTGEPGPEVFRE